MRRGIRWLLLVVLLIAAACGFWWLDFHMTVSNTQTRHDTDTYSVGFDPNAPRPDGVVSKIPLTVVVTGDPALARELRLQLDQIGRASHWELIELLDDLPDVDEGAVLWVDLDDQRPIWTPIWGRARMDIAVRFAATGDLSVLDQATIEMNSEQRHHLYSNSRVTVQDDSWGLLSRRGYHRMLSTSLVSELEGILSGIQEQML